MNSTDSNASKKIKAVFQGIVLLIGTSCADFIDIDPPKTEIITETVFSNDQSAMAAIRGVYSIMMSSQSFSNALVERYTGLSSDELVDFSGRDEQLEIFQNTISVTNPVVNSALWSEPYRYINNANNILEGIAKSSAMSVEVKRQLEGEAKFIRAFCHFYLVNFFGDVPYITTTDYRANAIAARLPVAAVYQRIEADLLEAQALLQDDFTYSKNQRTQPNKGAAQALLARIYLYTENWSKAEELASQVIDNSTYDLVPLDQIFKANSMEAIWQLQPVTPEMSTGQARLFILQGLPTNVVLKEDFLDVFEVGDGRKDAWVSSLTRNDVTYYFPFKYKVYTTTSFVEYATVLRLAEQYLIRCEARAHLDKLEEAIEDLDKIRTRAGLPGIESVYPSLDQGELIVQIEHERQIEFFAEWGHRWFDLKRTNRANFFLEPMKEDWQSTDALYPIPQSERLLNPNLTQNDGY